MKASFGYSKTTFLVFLLLAAPVVFGKELQKTAKPRPPIIVVDPGHGGNDPGAVARGIREKEVVLALAKKLAARLKKTGAQVTLTRAGDRLIPLGERDRIANRQSCDLFLSVHANASRNRRAQGVELYYLNRASDRASRRLARRENAGAPKQESELAAIVSDLIQAAATEESAALAQSVQDSVGRQLKKYRLGKVGVKTALFYVLVGAKCPSLLIESGFVTNPAEARRLKSAAYQKSLVEGIAVGVERYLKEKANRGDL